jgi:hypothetical protein
MKFELFCSDIQNLVTPLLPVSQTILLYQSTTHKYYQKGFVSILGNLHDRVLCIRGKKIATDSAKIDAPVMVNHDILNQYRARYRYLKYRGISEEIPLYSGNAVRRTKPMTNLADELNKDQHTQCTTTKKKHEHRKGTGKE